VGMRQLNQTGAMTRQCWDRTPCVCGSVAPCPCALVGPVFPGAVAEDSEPSRAAFDVPVDKMRRVNSGGASRSRLAAICMPSIGAARILTCPMAWSAGAGTAGNHRANTCEYTHHLSQYSSSGLKEV
jgi:hypothetical protein